MMISQAMQARLLAILLTDPDRTTIIRMSTMSDDPERRLRRSEDGTADIRLRRCRRQEPTNTHRSDAMRECPLTPEPANLNADSSWAATRPNIGRSACLRTRPEPAIRSYGRDRRRYDGQWDKVADEVGQLKRSTLPRSAIQTASGRV